MFQPLLQVFFSLFKKRYQNQPELNNLKETSKTSRNVDFWDILKIFNLGKIPKTTKKQFFIYKGELSTCNRNQLLWQ